MSNQPKTKKITGKSFKLYDFKTYDGAVAIESQSSSSSDEEEGKPKTPQARVFMIQCFGLNEKGRRVVYLSGISSRSFRKGRRQLDAANGGDPALRH
jgi:hypothetical protein